MDGYGVKDYGAGEVVFHEGEAGAEAFLVLNGRVAITRDTEEGAIVLGEYGERQIFGEIAVIQEATRAGTAQMLEAGQLVPIPAAVFNQQLEQAPPMIRTVVRLIARQLAASGNRVSPSRDRKLFLAMAHLLYQMNMTLRGDGTNAMPYEKAMEILEAVLERDRAEIEQTLQVYEDIKLITCGFVSKGKPQLKFVIQDGFLGRALRHYDQMLPETPELAVEAPTAEESADAE